MPIRPVPVTAALSLGWLLALQAAGPAHAAEGGSPNAAGIYTCIDAQGRRLTSDRPIRECIDREQRVLNRDGSQRRVMPPSMTADERAAQEEANRRRQAEATARLDAIKRDRNLLARFPNEEAHHKARESALDDARNAIRLSELRLEQLKRDRKPLEDEAAFYAGRALPTKLRIQMESIDAGMEAQRTLIQNQTAEMARVNALYDTELAHLRLLWSGSAPGSVGYPARPASATGAGGAAAGNAAAPAAGPNAPANPSGNSSGNPSLSPPASSSAAR